MKYMYILYLYSNNNFFSFSSVEGNLSHILQRIHTNGYTNQLSWLSTYISDEAKDRSLDNEWEELCIVTVDQSVAEALETELFCELMTTLGLTPPTDQVINKLILTSIIHLVYLQSAFVCVRYYRFENGNVK